MLEIITDVTHPSTLYGLYISFILGITVHLVWGLVVERHNNVSIISFEYIHTDIMRANKHPFIIFALKDWIARIIRRKESTDDGNDHCSFSKI